MRQDGRRVRRVSGDESAYWRRSCSSDLVEVSAPTLGVVDPRCEYRPPAGVAGEYCRLSGMPHSSDGPRGVGIVSSTRRPPCGVPDAFAPPADGSEPPWPNERAEERDEIE